MGINKENFSLFLLIHIVLDRVLLFMDYKKIFDRNIAYLSNCPFVVDFVPPTPGEVMINESDESFTVKFAGSEATTIIKCREFDFESLFATDPMVIENLDNINALQSMQIMVRQSKYCGRDNRVWLLFTDKNIFTAFLYLIDWADVLCKEQFMIVFDREGISSPNAGGGYNPLQIEEVNNLIVQFQNGNNGGTFLSQVLDQNPYNAHVVLSMVHYRMMLPQQILDLKENPAKKIMQDVYTCYNMEQIVTALNKYPSVLAAPAALGLSGETFGSVMQTFVGLFRNKSMTIPDIFKGFLISFYYNEQKERNLQINPKICPTFTLNPSHHIDAMEYILPTLEHFEKIIFIRTSRDPIHKMTRAFMTTTMDMTLKREPVALFLRYCVASSFDELYFDRFALDLGYPYYVIRFKDMKLKPEEYVKKLCYTLVLPYHRAMIANETIFNTNAVNPDISKTIFTDKDIELLRGLYSDISIHYGYSATKHKFDLQHVINHGFDLEKYIAKLHGFDLALVHAAFMEQLKKAFERPIEFPTWIR